MALEIFPQGFKDIVQAGLATNLPTTPNVSPDGASFTFYYATDTGILYTWNPVTAAWGTVSASGGAPTTVTSATVTAPSGRSSKYLLSKAAGVALTLPLATGSGISVEIEIGITATSGAYKVITGQATDYLSGNVTGQTGNAVKQFSGAIAATYCSLQMPFAGTQPSGGFEGDWFSLTDMAANRWLVKGMYQAGTTPTTPFSTATS